MNVVVVGGAGFIGSHLVDRLLAEGHHVDVVDDLSTGSLGNLADARASAGSLKIHHLDATTTAAGELIGMRTPDVIFHLALFPRRDRSLRPYGPGGVAGFPAALALLDAAATHAVGKVVVALPAGALYGMPSLSALPAKEGEVVPRGVRGVAAKSVVDLLTHYRDHAGVEFTALAPATVYGPRQHPEDGVVAAFRHAADAGIAPLINGDGRQTRDFVYVDDTIDAFVRAAERGSGLVINVGTGEQTSLNELWTAIAGTDGAVARLGDPRPDEMTRFAVSPIRARIHLGWAAWTDLSAGLGALD